MNRNRTSQDQDDFEGSLPMSPCVDESTLTITYLDEDQQVQFATMRFSAPHQRIEDHAPAWRKVMQSFLAQVGSTLMTMQLSHEQHQPIYGQRKPWPALRLVEKRSEKDRRNKD